MEDEASVKREMPWVAEAETREDKSLHQNLMKELIPQHRNPMWRKSPRDIPRGKAPNAAPQSFIRSADLVVLECFPIGEMCYRCSQYGKSFRCSCYLIWHQKIHTGEQP